MEKTLLDKLKTLRNGRDLKTTDIISINDLTRPEVEMIFELAEELEGFLKGEMKKTSILKGKSQLNFFMENSTRTRVSFELAGKNLGIDTINISADKSSIKKGETLLDTAITLDQMQPDIIVMRTGSSGAVRFFANNTKAAVLNAGDGWNEHPTQALLDLYTMQRKVAKDLKGKKLVIVGDVLHSRVFGSLARAAKMFEMEVVVTAPHTLVRPKLEEEWGIKHEPKIEKALEGADVVYVLRLQTERAAAAYVPTLREYSKTYVINAARMKFAKPNAVVMHAGPVIRELDVHTNILETEKSMVPHQVFSGYCIRFILLWLLGEKRKEKTVKSRLFKA
jgi:aspartate carbamoyltransferase catalytic subunit